METINHRRMRVAPWLAAVAVAIGFAAPAVAQSGSDEALPARPLGSPHWPEFAPPTDPTRSDSVKPGMMSTSTNIPPFSGFGAASSTPRPGSFPQPGFASNPSPDAAPSKVWTVAGQDRPATAPTAGERTPRDFGNGWKNYVSHKMKGREGPAAALATPRSASSGPRPEWNWHGYDNYNLTRPVNAELPANTHSNAADLAPFMKYAHLWRPANVAGGMPAQGLAQSGPAPLVPPAVFTTTLEDLSVLAKLREEEEG